MTEPLPVVDERPQDLRRCAGVNVDGTPCTVPPELVMGSGYCFVHDPDRQQEVAAARARGAMSAARKLRRGLDEGELGPLESPADAQRWSRVTAAAVASGRITAQQGQSVARLLDQWNKSAEKGAAQDAVAEIMKLIRDRARRGDASMLDDLQRLMARRGEAPQ